MNLYEAAGSPQEFWVGITLTIMAFVLVTTLTPVIAAKFKD